MASLAIFGRLARRWLGEAAGPLLDIFPASLSEDVATIPEVLRRLGIRSGMLSANYVYLASPFGLDRGFAYADSRPQNLLPVEFVGGPFLRQFPWTSWRQRYEWLAQTSYPAPHVIQRVTRWLDEHGDDQFFLLINFMDVHEPSSTSYAAREIPEIRTHFPETTSNDSLEYQYDVAMRYLDYHLGALIAELRTRRLLDDSLIIITSDHGESFSPRDSHRHGLLPFEHQIRVPMVIKAPGQKEGRRVQTPVQGIDILPTILLGPRRAGYRIGSRAHRLEPVSPPWPRCISPRENPRNRSI